MTTLKISSAKLTIPFKAGELPKVDERDPSILLDLDGFRIAARVNAKAARKLAVHPGGAVLQGRLTVESGHLVLRDAGFQWLEPTPATPETLQTNPVT
ncbi:MAG: hypothetical protein JO116_01640 [Planctomycetaceae bacterium]|nr:hypothetical protein [Planctomycetaceae bacterium]MBV8608337.1 hypothetical protein [Singulisphaera sp.]